MKEGLKISVQESLAGMVRGFGDAQGIDLGLLGDALLFGPPILTGILTSVYSIPNRNEVSRLGVTDIADCGKAGVLTACAVSVNTGIGYGIGYAAGIIADKM